MAYVALDLETTSTNPAKARIVQIAVVLLDNHMVEQAAWQQLVRPGFPIPPHVTIGSPRAKRIDFLAVDIS